MNWTTESNRIYVSDDNGKIVAEVTFPNGVDHNTIIINRTFVDESLRGQGIAGKLLTKVAELLQNDGRKAVASCSYAVEWFNKHPEYKHLLEDIK